MLHEKFLVQVAQIVPGAEGLGFIGKMKVVALRWLRF